MSYMREIIDNNINMTVPWYLMAAYAYYELDNPIMTDAEFDNLAKLMDSNWDSIEHYHKHLIDRDNLSAGTYLGTYPTIVKDTVETLIKDGKVV